MNQTERFNLSQRLRKEAFAAVRVAWMTNKPYEWLSENSVHVHLPDELDYRQDVGEITFSCRKNPVYEDRHFYEYETKLKAALREHGFKGVRFKKRSFKGYDPYGGKCGYWTGDGERKYYEITAIVFKIA